MNYSILQQKKCLQIRKTETDLQALLSGALCLIDLLEHVLADAADRAAPVIRQILEGRSGGDAAVGITDFGIIYITTGATLIFAHFCISFFITFFCFRCADQR